MRDKLSSVKEKNSFQKVVISDLKKDLKDALARNTTLENSLIRLKQKKEDISEEVQALRKKEAMLVRLEKKMERDMEEARELAWKEREERARLSERLAKIRSAARDLYGITK